MNRKVLQIIDYCAKKHGVSPESIVSRTRIKPVVIARHEAIWMVRKLLRKRSVDPNAYSLSRIGQMFGDRDHSTVFHALKAHRERL